MLLATLLVSRLSARFSAVSLALTGGAVATSGAIGSILAVLAEAPFPALLGSIMVLVFGLGISEPVLMGEAMNASDTGSGQAAALLGAAQFLLGAVATVIAGVVAAAGPLPWTLLLAGFAVLSLALVLLGLRATRSGAAG